MNITALDIRKQEFRKTLRGFDTEEVQVFLETAADAFEALTKENAAFRERIQRLEDSLAHYTKLEQTLQDTLVTAQQVTDSTRENARREADLIVKEARVAADGEIETARRQLVQIKRDIIDLRNYKETFIARLRALCRSHIELLQAFEQEDDEAPIRIEGMELEENEQGSMSNE
ncbi:MAG: DivIVA domain-containing protein [Candidatus Latescibacterota bacterium]|nr:DivIVA domain-containing protein [Candidatus Latescibacterota bacterium]RKY69775.1 MAG: DivIVA domain-containing protein [Candidatus Latescibacterota bacterium]